MLLRLWLLLLLSCCTVVGFDVPVVEHVFQPSLQQQSWPAQASTFGGTAIRLSGASFAPLRLLPRLGLGCRFGTQVVGAWFVAPEVVECTAPAHVAGFVGVALSLSNDSALQFRASDSAALQYSAAATTAAVFPTVGVGGSLLTLSGANFRPGASCRFDSAAAPARVFSSTLLRCVAPDGAGASRVAVANAGDAAAAPGVEFTFLPPPALHTAAPGGGSLTGGTRVVVSGPSLGAGEPRCCFGSTCVSAASLSDDQLACVSPAAKPAAAARPLTADFGNSGVRAPGAAQFLHLPVATVTAAVPEVAATSGGTVTQLYFSDAAWAWAASCLVGAGQSVATVLRAGVARCAVLSGDAGFMLLQLALDGVGDIHAGASVALQLVPPPLVSRPAAFVGPPWGGSLLHAVGTNFARGSACRFGVDATARAQWVSTAHAVCEQPALSAGSYAFDLTLGAADWTEQSTSPLHSTEFTAEEPAAAVHASPGGGSDAGGTPLLLQGAMGHDAAELYCSFGTIRGVAGVRVSATECRCTSPAHAPGAVLLQLNGDAQQPAGTALAFLYARDAQLQRMYGAPATGAVALAGSDFGEGASVTCLLCGSAPVSGFVLSSGLIECASPPWVGGEAFVEVRLAAMGGLVAASSPEVGYRFTEPELLLARVYPTAGPVAGGLVVRAQGANFRLGARCSFGASDSAPALFVSSALLLCEAPSQEAGSLVVRVHSAAGQWASTVGFVFDTPALFSHSAPARGPLAGGSMVHVEAGAHSSDEALFCRFGTISQVAATWTSPSLLACAAPAHAAGGVPFAVSGAGNRVDVVSSSFAYAAPPALETALPEAVFASALASVSVGSGELYPGYLACSTRQLTTAARDTGAGRLLCDVSPDMAGFFVLELIADQGPAIAAFQIVAQPQLHALQLQPSEGREGTLRTIQGVHLADSLLCVHDGRAGFPAHIISAVLVVCEGQALAPGAGSLLLSSPAGRSAGSLLYRSLPPVAVSGSSPRFASTAGATVVVLTTAAAEHVTACKFGTIFPVAAALAASEIRCAAPAHAPGTVRLAVSSNGRDIEAAEAPLLLTYYTPPQLLAVQPSTGWAQGGEPLTLTIDQAANGGTANGAPRCLFETSSSAALTAPGNRLLCLSRPHAVGFSTMSMLFAGDAAGAGVAFQYRERSVALAAQPTSFRAGTIVSVTTRDGTKEAAACLFYEGAPAASSMARYESSVLLRCEVPTAQPAALGAGFERATLPELRGISLGALEFSDLPEATVLAVVPSWSFTEGGLPVLVTSTSPQYFCRFGTVGPVSGRAYGSNGVVCSAPALAMQSTQISVATEPTAWLAPAPFKYFRRPVILASVPERGLASGGQDVLVALDSPPPGSGMQCAFSATPVQALQLQASGPWSNVLCASPAHSVGAVALNFGDYAFSRSSAAQFLYTHAPSVAAVHPTAGTAGGGTVVTVTGVELSTSLGALCSFGGLNAHCVQVSSVLARCETPAHSGGPAALASAATVVGLPFSFHPELLVTDISPAAGPETGGTVVAFTVSSAWDSAQLACRFGTVFPVAGARVGPSTLECISPASYPDTAAIISTPRAVPVCASGNRADCARGATTFQFQPTVHVAAVSPRAGIHLGQTPVFVTGAGFVNSSALACRFGLVTVPATYLSFANLLCLAPAQAPGPVFVEVSNNGGDFTSDRLLFYYGNCPVGHFCPDGEALACPRGAYCAGTSNFNYTLCPPGTFQPLTGQGGCLPAPVGFFAPDFGMAAPRICSRGAVCDVTGISSGLTPCPPGHYCLEGTRTANFTDFRLAERPLPCSFGFYCGPGVTTIKSVANNFTTPQPCNAGFFCEPGSVTPQGSGPCPSGQYCPPGQLIPCPPRTYCPNVGNTEPKPCLPGMYNNEAGQSTCKLCPIGTVCPGFTRELPEPCPAGYVCDEVGLPLPTTRCPAGHFCLSNTVTADPLAPLDEEQLQRALPAGFSLNASNFRPLPCYPATYCLDGVGNSTTAEGVYFNPQPCNAGSYCEWATSDRTVASASGTTDISNPKLPCPAGSYCPTGTYIPYPAPRGSFASGTGNAQSALCLPGTYTHYDGFQRCLDCPAGYECRTDGTYKPTICEAGKYRSSRDSITCLTCPVGTWSPYRGLTDEALCLPCNGGLVCSVDGMTNNKPYGPQGAVSVVNAQVKACEADPPEASCTTVALQPLGQAALCPEGYVCDARTTIATDKCPDGYFCSYGTTPESQFANPCPAGYFCPSGTSATSRYQFPCVACFYCPEGTGLILNRCPEGTKSLGGATTQSNCTADQITFWRLSPLRSSLIERTWQLKSGNLTDEAVNATNVTSSDTGGAEASSSALESAFDLLSSYACCDPKNYDALKPDFVTDSSGVSTEPITDVEGTELVYFQVPRNYIVKLTFDFRNISEELIYGDHYEVGIFTGDYSQQSACAPADYQAVPCPPWNEGDGVNQATMGVVQSQLYETKCPRSTNGLELPFWFARNGLYGSGTVNAASPEVGTYVNKRGMMELNLIANDELQFRVEIRMLHGLYQERNRRSFLNTLCVDMIGPTRGAASANSSFHIILPRRDEYQLPLNVPVNAVTQRSVPLNYLDCTSGGLDIDPSCRLVQPDTTLAFNSSFSSEYLVAERYFLQLNASAAAASNSTNGTMSNATSFDCSAPLDLGSGCTTSGCSSSVSLPLVGLSTSSATTVPDVISKEEVVLADTTKFWSSGDKLIAVDYLPYFSACRGFDANMFLYQLLETGWTPIDRLNVAYGQGCSLVGEGGTKFISQWAPQIFTATADTCDIEFTCLFQESYQTASAVSRWYEANGDTLFYITKEPQPRDRLFEASVASSSTSSPPHDTSFYSAALTTDGLMDIPFAPASGTYQSGTVPKSVVLTLEYFQYTRKSKRLVSAKVEMDEYQPAGTHNGQYKLNIVLTPLGWFELLNAFAFDTLFYSALFFGIGLLADGLMYGFWSICRAFTRLRDPPKFKGWTMLSVMVQPQVAGLVLAMFPFYLSELGVKQLFLRFSWIATFSPNIDTYLSSTADASAVSGRIGVCFLVIAVHGLWCASVLLVPDRPNDDAGGLLDGDADDDEDEDFFTPVRWRRSHFIAGVLMLVMCETCLAEFSTMDTYNLYLFPCWFMMKWFHFGLEKIFEAFVVDSFMVCAMGSVSECVEGLVTIAASTFTEFALAYFLDTMYDAFEAIFLELGLDLLSNQARETVRRLEKLYYRVRKRTITQQLLHAEEEEEDSALEDVMDAVCNYGSKATAQLMSPFILYLLWDYNAQLDYTTLWSINRSDLLLYVLFLVVMVPFQWVGDMFSFNATEMFLGWKIYDYLCYARYRFQNRTARWKGLESHLDESIDPALRATDQMCFSSQWYFVLGLVGSSGTMFMLGVLMLLRSSHNPFGDILFLSILLLIIGACTAGRKALLTIADAASLWKIRGAREIFDSHDVMFHAAELVVQPRARNADGGRPVGEYTSADLASDAFRQAFLDDNRMWVLEKLGDLVSPRHEGHTRRARALSSDDDSEDGAAAAFSGPVALSEPAAFALRQWAAAAIARAPGRLGRPTAAMTTDDEEDIARFPPAALSQTAASVLAGWLAASRSGRQHKPVAAALSSTGDATSEGDSRPDISLQPASQLAAAAWLAHARERRLRSTAPAPALDMLSSSEGGSTGGSTEDSSDLGGNAAVPDLSTRARSLVLAWLFHARKSVGTG